jgi:tetratricopeptide (TPR) repeat protein
MTDARLQDGFRAHQTGDLDKAERLYRDILNVDGSNFDALYLLGYIHLQRGHWEIAERQIGEALTVNPNSIDALFNRPGPRRSRAPAEALSCLGRALSIRPASGIVLTRGNVLLALNRAAEALANYDQALAVKPDFPEAWNNRGNALAALKRLDEALSSYERVLAARPGDVGALHHRALTLFELKRYEEAARGFADLLKAEPDFPYARGNLLLPAECLRLERSGAGVGENRLAPQGRRARGDADPARGVFVLAGGSIAGGPYLGVRQISGGAGCLAGGGLSSRSNPDRLSFGRFPLPCDGVPDGRGLRKS